MDRIGGNDVGAGATAVAEDELADEALLGAAVGKDTREGTPTGVWRTRSPGNVQTMWWERIATTYCKPKRWSAEMKSSLSPSRLSASTTLK